MLVTVLGKEIVVVEKYLSETLLGRFESDPVLTIYIKPGMKNKQLKRVLQHEMFHAMLWISGISQLLSQREEEALNLLLEYNSEDIINESKRALKELK